MPLIFLVLLFIVIGCSLHDADKNNTRLENQYSAAIRKTNARLEFEKTQEYYLAGDDLDTAIKKGVKFIIDHGYTPCIQKNAYAEQFEYRIPFPLPGWEHGCVRSGLSVYDIEAHDSELVKFKRREFDLIKGYKYKHKLNTPAQREQYRKKQEEYIYDDHFPTTTSQYRDWLESSTFKSQYFIEPGTYINHTIYGTLEVVDFCFNIDYTLLPYGRYRVKKVGSKSGDSDPFWIDVKDKCITRI